MKYCANVQKKTSINIFFGFFYVFLCNTVLMSFQPIFPIPASTPIRTCKSKAFSISLMTFSFKKSISDT